MVFEHQKNVCWKLHWTFMVWGIFLDFYPAFYFICNSRWQTYQSSFFLSSVFLTTAALEGFSCSFFWSGKKSMWIDIEGCIVSVWTGLFVFGYRFESILDLKPSACIGTGNSAPSYLQQDMPTCQVSAAKQHYLKHSRYLPG